MKFSKQSNEKGPGQWFRGPSDRRERLKGRWLRSTTTTLAFAFPLPKSSQDIAPASGTAATPTSATHLGAGVTALASRRGTALLVFTLSPHAWTARRPTSTLTTLLSFTLTSHAGAAGLSATLTAFPLSSHAWTASLSAALTAFLSFTLSSHTWTAGLSAALTAFLSFTISPHTWTAGLSPTLTAFSFVALHLVDDGSRLLTDPLLDRGAAGLNSSHDPSGLGLGRLTRFGLGRLTRFGLDRLSAPLPDIADLRLCRVGQCNQHHHASGENRRAHAAIPIQT